MILSNKIGNSIRQHDNNNIEKEDIEFLSNIASRIHKSGLVTPVVFFLEMTKPISSLGGHFLVFLGPILNAFIQSESYYRKVEVFEKRENIELLLNLIEDLEK